MTDDEVQDLTNYQNLSELLCLPGEEKSLLEQATKICFYTITIAVGLCANGLIIGVISATKSLRTKFNFYVVNLAVADVLVVVFCSWIHLVSDLKQQRILGSFMCTANTFVQGKMYYFTFSFYVILQRLTRMTQTLILSPILGFQASTTSTIYSDMSGRDDPRHLDCCSTGSPPVGVYVRQVEFQWATGLEIDCEDLFPSKDTKKIYITFFAVVLYVIPLCTMFALLFAILKTPKLPTRISEQSFPRNESRNEHQVSMTRFSDQVHERRISLNMELHQMQKMRQNVGHNLIQTAFISQMIKQLIQLCVSNAFLRLSSRTIYQYCLKNHVFMNHSPMVIIQSDIHKHTQSTLNYRTVESSWILYLGLEHDCLSLGFQAAVMILTLFVVFFICWTPQQTTLLWDVYRDRHKKVIYYAMKTIPAYSSSAVYPVVYMMFNKCFRIAAWKSLRFWKRGEHSVFTVSPCKCLSNQFSGSN
ncbi:orexin receptor type 2-like [Haliotis rufescens]|uniref:orexin receptor type 2-like n=1 Tax=Haliotis rufescens TaxID=6454 RepID=UPI00201EA13B|nr:orexin receptor type 2-like [Haliotis rufescens]